MDNNAMVGRGLHIVLPYLSAFVMREFRALAGNRWWSEWVTGGSPRGENLPDGAGMTDAELLDKMDMALCLKLVLYNWNDVFKRKMTREQRTWANELVDVRNRWAHASGEGFSDEDAARALDTMARFIQPIDDGVADQLWQMMRRIQYGTEGTSRQAPGIQPAPETQRPAADAAAGLKPWRLVAEPNPDVARGRYRQAEFAADLAQVARNIAQPEYQDKVEFFSRTYITGGMAGLLTQVIQRVFGKGGEPVIQLKTAFGGGKTHSMIALYHLLRNATTADRLPGVAPILARAGVPSLPETRVAVLVGTQLDPTKSRRDDRLPGHTINTFWGEMTAQLAKQCGNPRLYELIKESDKKGVSPGSEVLAEILDRAGPCLILIDELVSYARKIYGHTDLPAGTFEGLLSFVQELTEAARASKASLLVASIPESDIEMGGEAGLEALQYIEKVFGRMEAVWKPVEAEEGFEIVRRRLFKEIADQDALEAACRAFSQMYRENPDDFPVGCRELSYFERLKACYPIHPEVFDRLYDDWATLENFQRTRGVLRFIALTIQDLWERDNRDPFIMPGSINFGNVRIREELTRYLLEARDAWNTVIDKEVDGPRSTPVSLERERQRYAKVGAIRRVARTIALGSAPDVRGQGRRGLEAARIRLGVVQPGEQIAVFNEAIGLLQDKLTHLYSANQRFWYDTRPTLRKTVQDRALQFRREDMEYELGNRFLQKVGGNSDFVRIHSCPTTSLDVPDAQEARMVILPPSQVYKKNDEACKARVAAIDIFTCHGASPRKYRNMLAFAAADSEAVSHVVEEMRTLKAWESVRDEVDVLNLDKVQMNEVKAAIERSEKAVREHLWGAYCWLLVPTLSAENATGAVEWEVQKLSGSESPAMKASRTMTQNDLLVTQWSPVLLKMELDRWLWKDSDDIRIRDLWDFMCRHCYFHRLRDEAVLLETIGKGLLTDEYFAYAEGKNEDGRYLSLSLGKAEAFGMQSMSGMLVKVDAAKRQIEEENARRGNSDEVGPDDGAIVKPVPQPYGGEGTGVGVTPTGGDYGPVRKKTRRFYATAQLEPLRLGTIAGKINDEVIQHLSTLKNADVRIELHIEVEVADGIPDDVIRTVSENCNTLKITQKGFEE